jgi:hypothetical protein
MCTLYQTNEKWSSKNEAFILLFLEVEKGMEKIGDAANSGVDDYFYLM